MTIHPADPPTAILRDTLLLLPQSCNIFRGVQIPFSYRHISNSTRENQQKFCLH